MDVFTWPNSEAQMPASMTLRVISNSRESTSVLSADVQTLSLPGGRWGWVHDFPAQASADRQALIARLVRMRGRENRMQLWDFKRPVPRGTIKTAGITIGATAAQFATSIQLAGADPGQTLLGGDWIGLPTGQLVMCVNSVPVVADGAGNMTVAIAHELRAAIPTGGAVDLVRPVARFILESSDLAFPTSPGAWEPPLTLSWVEVFA